MVWLAPGEGERRGHSLIPTTDMCVSRGYAFCRLGQKSEIADFGHFLGYEFIEEAHSFDSKLLPRFAKTSGSRELR